MDRPSDHASKRALRACENCRERKVKCNSNPSSCQQCAHLNLRCVYKTSSTSTRSRANAGSRGSVISRLKGNGSHSVQQLLPLRETTASATVPVSPLLGGPSSHVPLESEFEQAFFRSLVQPYDDYIYCVSPIITAAEISASITTMHDDTVDFQLVHAFGAVTLNLTQPNWRADSLEATKVKRLMDIAISARSQLSTSFLSGYGGSGLRTMLDERFIMAGIFLEICLMGFRRHDEAFLMLREAISLIQLLQVRKARSSHQLDGSERTRQRAVEAKQERLYWEAFIHERFLAIVEYYPVMLEPLEDSIAVEDETLPVQVREGFQSLIQMFCVIDHEFVSHWRRGASATVTKEWIEAKKRELDNLDFMLQPQSVSSSVPMWHSLQARASESPASSQHMATENWTSLNTLQQADLVITRQWMLTLLWQLALSHCVLPSSSPRSLGNDEGRNWNAATRDHGNHGNHVSTTDTTSPSNDHERRLSDPAASVPLSLSFPVRLSQQLRAVITQLGRKYIERHGSGIIQKLFEITATFADVIVHVPVSSPSSSSSSSPTAVAEVEEERAQRLRDFEFLLNFLREFAGLDEIQARILSEKAELVRGVEHANSTEALCYTRTEEGK